MRSEFMGCTFDRDRGLCEGHSYSETWEIQSRLACPEGWFLGVQTSETDYAWLCYRPDHPDYWPH